MNMHAGMQAAGFMSRYLAARLVAGVETIDASRYRRTLQGQAGAALFEVDLRQQEEQPRFSIDGNVPAQIDAQVSHLLDAAAPSAAITDVLSADPLLEPLLRQTPGLRIPGTMNGFELSVRAILGQQISVVRATAIAGQLAAHYGQPLPQSSRGLTHTFPEPSRLADATLEQFGLPRSRAGAIRALAAAVAAGEILLLPGARHYRDLLALPGIGPWTASYIALRALGDKDSLPSSDLGLRQALGGAHVRPADVEQRAERWRPYRGYAAMYLWGTFLPARTDPPSAGARPATHV